MFLSVIIPCYRETHEQLTRCLDSLLFLTDLCDWEAWIVDDGSPSGSIAEWVGQRDDTHLHVLRQTNQGQSVARNNAIEHATGQYIALLDADDEWIPSEYAKLIRILKQKEPDLLGLRYQPTQVPYFEGKAIDFIQQEDIIPAACGYIFRRSKLGSLRYTPGVYHEDEEFNTLLHLQMDSLIMTPIVAYRYNATPNSTVNSRDELHLRKRFSDFLGVIRRIQHTATGHPELRRRIHVMAMCFIVDLMRSAPSGTFVNEHLSLLRAIGLYPLPAYKGIRRYSWIRPLTSQPWLCRFWRKFL